MRASERAREGVRERGKERARQWARLTAGGMGGKSARGSAAFSDDNAQWLKPKKKASLFDDEDEQPVKLAKAKKGKPVAAAERSAPLKKKSAAVKQLKPLLKPVAAKPPKTKPPAVRKRKQPPPPAEEESVESEEGEEADSFDEDEIAASDDELPLDSGDEEGDESGDDDEEEEGDEYGVGESDEEVGGKLEEEEEDDDESGSDEDDEASDELEFERKARETVARLAEESRLNQAEQLDMAASFTMPTAQQLAEEAQAPPDIPMLKQRVADVVEVLGEFAVRRQEGVTRADYVALLAADLQICYGYNGELVELLLQLFSPTEALEFINASEKPRPVTIRTNTLKTRRKELAQALIARNVSLDPISKWSTEGLQIYESAVPIGATPEYLAGHYMIQSASSFLPVLALDVQPGQRVLDMAASPGGKTSHIAARMANQGTLVANDFNKQRIAALASNLSRQGVRCAITIHADGREFPKLMGGFDRVLLDAPCTGLGVISKDPAVKAEKGFSDIQRCQQLQKELLLAAIDSCNANAPGGGIIVYSTCSIAVEENETIVDYALASRSVKLIDSGLPFGVEGLTRYRSKRFHASLKHARRFYPHTHNMDGFFVAKLRKYSNSLPGAAQLKQQENQEDMPTWKAAAAKQAGKGKHNSVGWAKGGMPKYGTVISSNGKRDGKTAKKQKA